MVLKPWTIEGVEVLGSIPVEVIMRNYSEIEWTLDRMAELLRSSQTADWADAIGRLRAQIDVDPENACSALSRLFGGMGSLNDVVLYRDGKVLRQENQEVDSLRSKLYSLLVS